MSTDAQLALLVKAHTNAAAALGTSIFMMTYKLSKTGQTGLVFGVYSKSISKSVHAGLQVSMCSSYDLCQPG